MENTSSSRSLKATVFTFIYCSCFLLHVSVLRKPKPNQRTRAFLIYMANSEKLFGVVRKKLLKETTKEDIAATRACFRGHLVRDKPHFKFKTLLGRRTFRALKSIVKHQAVARRRVLVKRQARIVLHCMHALARLQIRVRARQILSY